MKRKVRFFCVFLLTVFLALSLSACGQKQAPQGQEQKETKSQTSDNQQKGKPSITIATTGANSTFATIMIGVGDILQKNANMSVSVQPTGGADAIINTMLNKKADLGTPNSTGAYNVFYGKRQFEKVSKAPIRLVMQAFDSQRYLIVRADSGIKTLADLKGKTIMGKRRAVADIEIATNAFLKIGGVPVDQVKVVESTEVNESLDALRMGSVDAVLMVQTITGPGIQELSRAIDIRVLGVPEEKIPEMLSILGPAFRKVTIPAGTVKGNDQPITMVATPMLIVARADVPVGVVYDFIKTIVDKKDDVKLIHAEAKTLTVENTLNSPPIPFHDGVVKYFKDNNLWTKQLDEWQTKSLEAQK